MTSSNGHVEFDVTLESILTLRYGIINVVAWRYIIDLSKIKNGHIVKSNEKLVGGP